MEQEKGPENRGLFDNRSEPFDKLSQQQMEVLSSETNPRKVTIAYGNFSALHQEIINKSKQMVENPGRGSNAEGSCLGHLGTFLNG